MGDTDANKAFIREMIGSKRSLEDYPDRFDPGLVMREPSTLPFGGTFHGSDEFRQFYPAVRAVDDFDRFELIAVYGDGDTVFATIQAGLAQSGEHSDRGAVSISRANACGGHAPHL